MPAASGELAGLRARGSSQSKYGRKANAKDQDLPPRLREKIEALEVRLRHASGPLKAYGQAAIDRVRGKQGAKVDMAVLDAANLDAMVKVENQRNPGLNLRHFSHQKDFIAALEAEGPASFRAIFPQTDESTGKAVPHHVMADVRRNPGKPPTVVVTEPAIIIGKNVAELDQLQRHNGLLFDLDELGIPLSHVAIIETGAQKSNDDCAMYLLHYAIKAHKNETHFDGLHEALDRGEHPAGAAGRESLAQTTLSKFPGKALYSGTHAAFGADVLPPDFYKHGASLAQARQLMSRPDERMTGRINGPEHDQAETLIERNEAFRMPRRTLPGDSEPSDDEFFSASIDGFRLQEIERALAAAAGEPVVPSKSYL